MDSKTKRALKRIGLVLSPGAISAIALLATKYPDTVGGVVLSFFLTGVLGVAWWISGLIFEDQSNG